MFTIDLLNGESLPVKSRPAGIVIALVTFAVPVITAIVMLSFYLSDRILMSVQNQSLSKCEAEIDKLSEAVELQELFEREKENVSHCLSEVASSIRRHMQWSPVLVTIAEKIPEPIAITKLNVKESFVRRKVAKKDDPKKKVDVMIPIRILEITVIGKPNYNSDTVVRDFKDRLRFSDVLGPKLKDITVAKEVEATEAEAIVSYEMSCVFKEGI